MVERTLSSYAHVWRARDRAGDPARCRAAVHEGGRGTGFHQCNRKPIVERELTDGPTPGTFGFCRQHDPIEARKRDQETRARWAAEERARRAKATRSLAIEQAERACIDALIEIQEGHNDPRTRAREAIDRLAAAKAMPRE